MPRTPEIKVPVMMMMMRSDSYTRYCVGSAEYQKAVLQHCEVVGYRAVSIIGNKMNFNIWSDWSPISGGSFFNYKNYRTALSGKII